MTGNNLDEKKKERETAKGNISIPNVNEYRKYSHRVDNEFECFIF